MKRLLLLILFFALPALGQTTLTLSNTVLHSNIATAGVDPSYLTDFGNQQYLKSLFYSDGGDLPGYYMQTVFTCSTGGTQSTTNWFYSGQTALGFPANFMVGATFDARNSATGASLGTGTITAQTASTGGTGPNFTLSPAISAPCTTGNPDVLIVRLTASNQLMTPSQLFGNTGATIPGSSTFDYSDIDPVATNQQQSLVLQPSTTLSLATDQIQGNRTNPNVSLEANQVANINLNGTYTVSFKYKCGASSGTNTIAVAVFRDNGVGSPFYSTTVTPTCSATNGAGWTTFTDTFTASETGTGTVQQSNLRYSFACGGSSTCKLTEMDVIEGSLLSGNTSPWRDAFIYALRQLHPGVIRWMSPGDWCADMVDQIQPMQDQRWCNVNTFTAYNFKPAPGYDAMLSGCLAVGADCAITGGNIATDYSTLPTWLSTNANYIALVAAGHKVFVEHGNEAFNSSAGGALYEGDGVLYGALVGPDVAAMRAASGYSSANMKLVANSWWATNQSYGAFGWAHNMLQKAAATTNGCPDGVEIAPYLAPSFLGTDEESTTGEPYLGLFTNVVNWDSVASPPGNPLSVIKSTQYVSSTQTSCTSPAPFTMIYEHGVGTVLGIPNTQARLNQITAGVGQAIGLSLHQQLMIRDSGVTGPLGTFALGEGYTGYTCQGYNAGTALATTTNGSGTGLTITTTATNGSVTGGTVAAGGTGYVTGDLAYPPQSAGATPTAYFTVTAPSGTVTALTLTFGGNSCPSSLVTPAWGIIRTLNQGPAQVASAPFVEARPQYDLMSVVNSAIVGKTNMMTVTSSGTTYSYPGGQPQTGANQIFANAAVPYVEGVAYSDGANHWATIIYNTDLVNSQSVTLAGAGAPASSSVTQTLYPASGENVESNNEALYTDPASLSLAQDVIPTPTSTSGNSYTIPPASALILTYTLGGGSTSVSVSISGKTQITALFQ